MSALNNDNAALSHAHSFNLLDFDAYLFDIDGTLLNSNDGVHYDAFHAALKAYCGCALKIDSVPVHGNTDVGILRAASRLGGVSDEDFAERLPSAKKLMCAETLRNANDMRPELCPSTAELLAFLQTNGKTMGIVSGNLEQIGWLKLEAANIKQFFTFGSFSDCNELREDIYRCGMEKAQRLLGARARVCFVGDTPADVLAAKALGTPVIAVATGIFSPDELRALGPEVCVSSCTELLTQG
jgi:phosphoglycolate phosphatase